MIPPPASRLGLRRAALAGPRPRGSYDVRALDDHTVLLTYPQVPLRLVARLSGAGTLVLIAQEPERNAFATRPRAPWKQAP